jgi:hypothetical protein
MPCHRGHPILSLSIAMMPCWHLVSVPVALALAVLRPALACAPLCTTHNSSLLLVCHSPSACCSVVARDSTPRIVSIQISGSVVSSSRGYGSIAPHHLLELMALGMAGGAIRRQPLLSPAHVVMACSAVPSLPCSCSITPETRPSVLRIWSSRDLLDLGPYHDIILCNASHLVVLQCYDGSWCLRSVLPSLRALCHACACLPRYALFLISSMDGCGSIPSPRGSGPWHSEYLGIPSHVISWYWLSSPPVPLLSTHCVWDCCGSVCLCNAWPCAHAVLWLVWCHAGIHSYRWSYS